MKQQLLSCAALALALVGPVAIADPMPGPMWDDHADSGAEAEREPVEWDLTRLYADVEAWDAARLSVLERLGPIERDMPDALVLLDDHFICHGLTHWRSRSRPTIIRIT